MQNQKLQNLDFLILVHWWKYSNDFFGVLNLEDKNKNAYSEKFFKTGQNFSVYEIFFLQFL